MQPTHPFNLSGKLAVVTGGGTGLGLGIARCFVQAGAKVVLIGRDREKLSAAASQLGSQACWIEQDLADTARLPEMVAELLRSHGTPDILVNNAGRHLKKPSFSTTDAEFAAVLQTNLMAVFALTRECAHAMLAKGGGSIILIGSMTSLFGLDRVAAYSVSKTALLGLMRTLVVEYAAQGLRVNTIAPGWIESDMLQQALANDPQRAERILQRIPQHKMGTPEDIGHAALFLASDQARYVNGVVLPVDGGATIGF